MACGWARGGRPLLQDPSHTPFYSSFRALGACKATSWTHHPGGDDKQHQVESEPRSGGGCASAGGPEGTRDHQTLYVPLNNQGGAGKPLETHQPHLRPESGDLGSAEHQPQPREGPSLPSLSLLLHKMGTALSSPAKLGPGHLHFRDSSTHVKRDSGREAGGRLNKRNRKHARG